MLDAIKDTNFWSKPFKNIDGKIYTDKLCYGLFTVSVPVTNYDTYYHILTNSYAFYSVNERCTRIISKSSVLVYDTEYIKYGVPSIQRNNSNMFPLCNDWYYSGFTQPSNRY